MGYRRGFKSDAEGIARDVRAELGLLTLDRLDPIRLASHLAIPVIGLSQLPGIASDVRSQLQYVEPQCFSAMTVFNGTSRVVVHNDSHSSGRQASNITHELAHGLLMHPPSPALDDRGCRNWNQNIEDEAEYLAGALLLPRDACLAWVFRSGSSIESAATAFGVSPKMAKYRLNISGAFKIAERVRKRHAP